MVSLSNHEVERVEVSCATTSSFDKLRMRSAVHPIQRDTPWDACVEMNLDLVRGVSPKYRDSQFALGNLVVTQFSEHVGYK